MQEKGFCTKNIKIKCWSMLRLAAFCEIIRIDIMIRPGSEGSDPSTRDPDPARGCLRSASLPLQHYQKPKPSLKLVPSCFFFIFFNLIPPIKVQEYWGQEMGGGEGCRGFILTRLAWLILTIIQVFCPVIFSMVSTWNFLLISTKSFSG